jgi:ribonuclease HI
MRYEKVHRSEYLNINKPNLKTLMSKHLTIYTDGGARGNPGPAGIGVVAYDESGEVVFEISKYLGEMTNNQAEYRALIAALEKAGETGAETIEVMMDSELIVKQINREYKVKNAGLAPLFIKVYNLTQSFKSAKFKHIRREQNAAADKLANEAMDRGA